MQPNPGIKFVTSQPRRNSASPAVRCDYSRTLNVVLFVSAIAALFLLVVVTATPAGPPGPDSDGDGIPDYWEILHGLNPLDPTDALLDPDGDGIANVVEYFLGGNPNVPDRSILPAAGRTGDGTNFIVAFNRRNDHDGLLAEVQANTTIALTNSWSTNAIALHSLQGLTQPTSASRIAPRMCSPARSISSSVCC